MSEKTTKTKAELFKMLAEAVRNTQPQPIEAEPTLDVRAQPKRKTQLRKSRLTSKTIAKAKKVRRPADRTKAAPKAQPVR